MLMKIVLLFVFATAVYADGIRQPSGQVARVGINGRTPSAGSHSRERVDGQYSAMPSGAASEVRGLSASTGQVGAVVVPPTEEPETGGSLIGPPQPMESASPEPSSWLLFIGALLLFVLTRAGRKEGKQYGR